MFHGITREDFKACIAKGLPHLEPDEAARVALAADKIRRVTVGCFWDPDKDCGCPLFQADVVTLKDLAAPEGAVPMRHFDFASKYDHAMDTLTGGQNIVEVI